MRFLTAQHRHLEDLARQNRRRHLQGRTGADFSSNDYLALASAPELRSIIVEALDRGASVGSGGSRLLRGNHPEHEALEAEAALFFGSETALYFSSGYAANSALLSALPQRGDLIIYDELVHASSHEGMRLGRAEYVAAMHNDPSSFEEQVLKWRQKGGTGTVWFAAESLYSMDGDFACIDELAAVADRHEAMLIIDEAHATGVYGRNGKGLAAHLHPRANIITLHTCGKALGCEGALVCAPAIVRDFLINRARAFIFSTAPSPLMTAAVRGALRLIRDQPERRDRLHGLVSHAQKLLGKTGTIGDGSQILPIMFGDEARALAAATALQAEGFDVRAIRPPTVPPGTSRLRISITNNVDEAAIFSLAAALERVTA